MNPNKNQQISGRKVTRAFFSTGITFGPMVRQGLDEVKDGAAMELAPAGLVVHCDKLSKQPILVPFSHIQCVYMAAED